MSAAKVWPAVVPAAGASRRMGEPKLLLPWGTEGKTVVESTLGALAAGGAGPVVAVLGAGRAGAPELADKALGAGAVVAWNPDPERGMLTTIQVGLATVSGAVASFADGAAVGGVLFAPADLPALKPSTVAAVIAALGDGAPLAVARHDGRRGHPLGVAAALLAEIDALDPEVGLRQLLDRHAAAIRWVDVDDPGALADVDTPGDLPSR